MPQSPLLRVKGLTKGFQAPAGYLEVLQGIDLDLEEHQFLAIVGESGSGKSTLLQVVGTLEPADGGEAYLDGEAIFHLPPARQAKIRNQKIGFVYQAHHLIPELTALENTMLPMQIQGHSVQHARERGEELLVRLGLKDRMGHLPSRLSGGEAQRVAVARALAVRPRLLLADEPTGNLDEKTSLQVFDLMLALCREEAAAVMMVTHSSLLASYCDQRMRLHLGQLLPE